MIRTRGQSKLDWQLTTGSQLKLARLGLKLSLILRIGIDFCSRTGPQTGF